MRDVGRWWVPLYNKLGNKATHKAPTLFRAECGIWLAQYLGIAPRDLWGALGLSEWLDPAWSAEQRRALAIARCYFPTGHDSWRRAFGAYQEVEQELRLYELSDDLAQASLIEPPSGYTSGREDFYRALLSTPPTFKVDGRPLAKPGSKYHYEVRIDEQQVVYDFTPPEWWARLDEQRAWSGDSLDLAGHAAHAPLTITRQALETVADFLDHLEQASQATELRLQPGGWRRRLAGMSLRWFEGDDLVEANELVLDSTVHLPGVLAVGKSTLMVLAAVWCAVNGYHATLVVGDVSTTLQIANDINNWLLHPLVRSQAVTLPEDPTTRRCYPEQQRRVVGNEGLPVATPILGRTGRAEHIAQLTRDTEKLARQYNVLRLQHWGWRWLNTSCALAADSRPATGNAQQPMPPGQEPCERLLPFDYATARDQQRKAPKRQKSNGEEQAGEAEVISACPLMDRCPVRQADRDLVTASIWITTPQALVQSQAPRLVTSKRMTVYEMVYRRSDAVMVDECDAAQAVFDSAFMPSETLAQPGGVAGLFGELVAEVNSRGALSAADDDTRAWISAVYSAKKLTELLYDILTSKERGERIRSKLGNSLFSDTDLFVFILWELLGVTDSRGATEAQEKAHHQCFEELRPFVLNPDGNRDMIANELLAPLVWVAKTLDSEGHTAEVRRQCEDWVDYARAWAEEILAREESGPTTCWSSSEESQRGVGEYWQSLAALVEFTVLVIVLDKRLTTIVTDWDAAPAGVTARRNRLRRWGKDLESVLPLPPTGQVFGFQYTGIKGRPDLEGTLRYFQFSAVGRWLLLQFHNLFQDLDGIAGPHTLLLSGTSWAPPSSAHVQVAPAGALAPGKKSPTTHQWQWQYTPVLRVSGATGTERLSRAQASGVEMGRSGGVIRRTMDELARLEQEDPEKWADRRRVLVLTGSYREAESAWNGLSSGCADLPDLRDGIYLLTRAQEHDETRIGQVDSQARWVTKGSLRDHALVDKIKILTAPMGSLGRAVNILNRDGKAAFGAIMFVVRALRPPHDPETHARRLVYWIQRRGATATTPQTFGDTAQALRREAHTKWYALLIGDKPWRRLPMDDRDELAATVFTQTWQAAGRGIRGDVPVIVHFVDEAYGVEEGDVLQVMATCYDRYLARLDSSRRDRLMVELLYGAPIRSLRDMLTNS
jgi:hypothetical protein